MTHLFWNSTFVKCIVIGGRPQLPARSHDFHVRFTRHVLIYNLSTNLNINTKQGPLLFSTNQVTRNIQGYILEKSPSAHSLPMLFTLKRLYESVL